MNIQIAKSPHTAPFFLIGLVIVVTAVPIVIGQLAAPVRPQAAVLALLSGLLALAAAGTGLFAALAAAAPRMADEVLDALGGKAWLVFVAGLTLSVLALCAAKSALPGSRVGYLLMLLGVCLACLAYLGLAAYYRRTASGPHAQAWQYGLYASVVAFLPLLITAILVGLLFQKGIADYVPFHKDELFYWHQSKTFAEVGFAGGYYTAYEKPALASFTHFGPHGFMLPMIYGLLGRLLGWQAHSFVVFNHLLLGGALLVLIAILKPSRANLAWLAALVGTYTPILYFAGSAWSEGLQLSLAIVLAALFINVRRHPSRFSVALLAAALLVSVLARPTWAVLIPPFMYFAAARLPMRWRLGLAMAGFGIALLAYKSWEFFASPYPVTLPLSQGADALALSASIATVSSMLAANLASLVSYSPFQMTGAVVWSSLLVLVLMLAELVQMWRARTATHAHRMDLPTREAKAFLAYLLAAVFPFLLLFLPFPNRGERYLAGFLLFSILTLFSLGRSRLVLALLALQVIALPGLIRAYQSDWNVFYYSPVAPSDSEAMQQVAQEFLIYQEGANPWCNSLLTENIFQTYMHVPAGIGIASKFEDDDVEWYTTPFKSRYILLDRKMEGQNWLWLADTPYGGLYLNQDADCSPLSP